MRVSETARGPGGRAEIVLRRRFGRSGGLHWFDVDAAERDACPRPARRTKVPFGEQLFVRLYHDAPRETEVGGQRARGGDERVRFEPAPLYREPQLAFELHAQGNAASPPDGKEKLPV